MDERTVREGIFSLEIHWIERTRSGESISVGYGCIWMLFEGRLATGEVRGRETISGAEENEDGGFGTPEAGVLCCTEIAPCTVEILDTTTGIAKGNVLRLVGGVIVDNEDFCTRTRLCEEALERLLQGCCLVMTHNNCRNVGMVHESVGLAMVSVEEWGGDNRSSVTEHFLTYTKNTGDGGCGRGRKSAQQGCSFP